MWQIGPSIVCVNAKEYVNDNFIIGIMIITRC